MIFTNTPDNEAIVSNVSEIGEFKIRNSAKAFGILSSGLYANKIRAVIRELSCNAVDSHVAAGKKDTPFDVHLPNTIEPWFAVRDYGVGLNHDQVCNIYTTYFESTKTNSNDFIGGLGLGSKSPFAHTDNFTVTATKDGKQGIYTAFINEAGVPSIALMTEFESTDPNGVEVKFAVTNTSDFNKFESEARKVFGYFTLQPVVSGTSGFRPMVIKYIEKNVIPGINYMGNDNGYSQSSVAVMGNVPYGIDVPNPETNLGGLAQLLGCGLELHFNIGEIDFQASREGLQYNAQTIAAIKAKLEALNAVLVSKLAKEADAITNLWERAWFLQEKADQRLYCNAVLKYVTDTKFQLADASTSRYRITSCKIYVTDLASKYNIKITAFSKRSYYNSVSVTNPDYAYDRTNPQYVKIEYWSISPAKRTNFVINDTKVGAGQRAKYHYRKDKVASSTDSYVYVLEKADKTKEMDTAGFFKEMLNPPATQIALASTLMAPARKASVSGGPVAILKLVRRESGSRRHSRYDEMVWRDSGITSATVDNSKTYYYLPITGHEAKSIMMTDTYDKTKPATLDAKELQHNLSGTKMGAFDGDIYGVRKMDIDTIKTLKNWVNLETHIVETLKKLDKNFWTSLAVTSLDKYAFLHYNNAIAAKVTDKTSLFSVTYGKFGANAKQPKVTVDSYYLEKLWNRYMKKATFPLTAEKEAVNNECAGVGNVYPLLKHLGSAAHQDVAEYINLVNSKKVSK